MPLVKQVPEARIYQKTRAVKVALAVQVRWDAWRANLDFGRLAAACVVSDDGDHQPRLVRKCLGVPWSAIGLNLP